MEDISCLLIFVHFLNEKSNNKESFFFTEP